MTGATGATDSLARRSAASCASISKAGPETFRFLGQNLWKGTNLNGILYPSDTTFRTQLLLQTFLKVWIQCLNLPPSGNLSKVGTQLTTKPREVSNNRAEAVKKDDSQASAKEEGEDKSGSLLLLESLSASSFFLLLSFLLLLPLLLLLLLLPPPPPSLGLDMFDPLPEPEPPAFLSLLGDLYLTLDLDLDLLLDLEQDLPLLVLWPPPPPRLPAFRLVECICTVLFSNSSSLVGSNKQVLTADSPPKRPSVPSADLPEPLAAAYKRD